jgi:hypothetical protein
MVHNKSSVDQEILNQDPVIKKGVESEVVNYDTVTICAVRGRNDHNDRLVSSRACRRNTHCSQEFPRIAGIVNRRNIALASAGDSFDFSSIHHVSIDIRAPTTN